MLDDFDGIETAFSLGVGPNVDWDYAIAERGLIVHQFDHTVDQSPLRHERFRFHKQMIASVPTNGAETLTSMLDHASSHAAHSNILKIDIENAEWDVFAKTNTDVLDKFSQILVEFHALEFLHLDDHWQSALNGLSLLKKQFEVIHVHANNSANITYIDDRPIPFVIEASMVSRARYETIPSEETYPGPLDRANDPSKADYELGRFDC